MSQILESAFWNSQTHLLNIIYKWIYTAVSCLYDYENWAFKSILLYLSYISSSSLQSISDIFYHGSDCFLNHMSCFNMCSLLSFNSKDKLKKKSGL